MPVQRLTSEAAARRTIEGPCPSVVLYTAPWCGHCLTFAPEYEMLAKEFHDGMTFASANVDKLGGLKRQQGITALPTCRVYRGGQLCGEIRGANVRALRQLLHTLMPVKRKGNAAERHRQEPPRPQLPQLKQPSAQPSSQPPPRPGELFELFHHARPVLPASDARAVARQYHCEGGRCHLRLHQVPPALPPVGAKQEPILPWYRPAHRDAAAAAAAPHAKQQSKAAAIAPIRRRVCEGGVCRIEVV